MNRKIVEKTSNLHHTYWHELILEMKSYNVCHKSNDIKLEYEAMME